MVNATLARPKMSTEARPSFAASRILKTPTGTDHSVNGDTVNIKIPTKGKL